MKVGAVESYQIDDRTVSQKRVAVSIHNVGHAMRIFAESTYSRPIEAVVREKIANAVDASRFTTKPIEVTVPSLLEPNFKVRDFGVGIDEAFFCDGYTKVGYSTKRDSNDEIGGFGQGRFAAFAYAGCDQFYVRGYKNGKTFLGSVYRDADFNISVQVEHSGDTTEPDGTEIIVPVKTVDHAAFTKAVKIFTEFVTPKPVCAVAATPRPTLFEGKNKNWRISAFNDRGSFEGEHIRAIMGGVPYKLDFNQVFGYYSDQDMKITAADFIFPIGALSIPASREELRYDDQTKLAIRNLLKDVRIEIEAEIADRQKHLQTDWEKWTDKSVAAYQKALGKRVIKTFKASEIGDVALMHDFNKFKKCEGRSFKINDHLEIDSDHNYLVYLIDDPKSWRGKVALDGMAKVIALDAALTKTGYDRHAKGTIVVLKDPASIKVLGDVPYVATSTLPKPPKVPRIAKVAGPQTKRVSHYFELGTNWYKAIDPDFTQKDVVWIPFDITQPTDEFALYSSFVRSNNRFTTKIVGVPKADWSVAKAAGWIKIDEWAKSLVTPTLKRARHIEASCLTNYHRNDEKFCRELSWLVKNGFKLSQADRLLQQDIILYTDVVHGKDPTYSFVDMFVEDFNSGAIDKSLDLVDRVKAFRQNHLLFYWAASDRAFSNEVDRHGGSVPTVIALAKKAL